MDEIEVQVTRKVRVGAIYRINGSYGYDIANGMVKVTHIKRGYEMPKDEIMNWLEVQTQSMDKDDSYSDRMSMLEDVYEAIAGAWVYYEYADGETEGNHIPIQLFVDHISIA